MEVLKDDNGDPIIVFTAKDLKALLRTQVPHVLKVHRDGEKVQNITFMNQWVFNAVLYKEQHKVIETIVEEVKENNQS